MKTVVTLIGLPGSGKTTLADKIHKRLGGARINADQIRGTISQDLRFSDRDRELQAYRLGLIASISLTEPFLVFKGFSDGINELEGAAHLNKWAVVDFVCPTERTLEVFVSSVRFPFQGLNVCEYIIFMDTITPEECRFPDTAKLYQRPKEFHQSIVGWKTDDELDELADSIAENLITTEERRKQ